MLAQRFVKSQGFIDDPKDILFPLCDFTGDLTLYGDVILEAANVVSEALAVGTRDLRTKLGYSGNYLAKLVMRLYDHAHGTTNEALQRACLDRWDALLDKRVGMAEETLRLLDD